MNTKLPPSLNPLYVNHPASSAYRVILSPHEWTWTIDEQIEIAKALVTRDGQFLLLRCALANFVGADSLDELKGMLELIKPFVEANKDAKVSAQGIEALIATASET